MATKKAVVVEKEPELEVFNGTKHFVETIKCENVEVTLKEDESYDEDSTFELETSEGDLSCLNYTDLRCIHKAISDYFTYRNSKK